jgi:putative lipoic acid-binding regulatory protein
MSDDKPDSEQLLQFPCSFPIKAMGRDEPGFRDTVVDIIEKHAGDIDDDAVRVSASSKGNFVSVTVTITAESQSQLDSIYHELTDNKNVLVGL